MDQPYQEDLAAFEQNLSQALKIQMAEAVTHPRIDLSLIADKLAAFTWKGVFDRVQKVYFEVIQGQMPLRPGNIGLKDRTE
jgi:hypothetical protein